jgi:RNA polymerase sigma factor (sigma-70 family)
MELLSHSSELPAIKQGVAEMDHDLIQACHAGDGHAWERLLDKYERLVFSIPLNYGLSTDDAADVTQITFTILIQSLETLRADTRLAPWLATVARRHTWRLLARNRRESVNPEEDLGERESVDDAADPLERWERIEWLNQGLNMLDERCRRLLLALYFELERRSYAQVALGLNMPVGSIGPTRARCLEQLKRHLTDQSGPLEFAGNHTHRRR